MKHKQNLRVGDHVTCSSCKGRGYYSVGHDGNNIPASLYDYEYSSDHNCHNCRRSGYLEVIGFNRQGAVLVAGDVGWVWGEDGDFS